MHAQANGFFFNNSNLTYLPCKHSLGGVQEQSIRSLEQNIEALSNVNVDADDDPELNELIIENTKLKHRLAILNKVDN